MSRVPFAVIETLTSERFAIALAGVTIGLCVAAAVAPLRLGRARSSAVAARVSPLWLPFPTALFLLGLYGGTSARKPAVALVLLITQLGLGCWMVYRHRQWPWLVVPLAASVMLWWGVAASALALAGMPH